MLTRLQEEVEEEPEIDDMTFAKERSAKNSENHTWKKNNSKDTPGVPMIVVKVISPDEMVLKYADKDPTKYDC